MRRLVVDTEPDKVTEVMDIVLEVVKIWKKRQTAQLILSLSDQSLESPIERIGSVSGEFAGAVSRLG